MKAKEQRNKEKEKKEMDSTVSCIANSNRSRLLRTSPGHALGSILSTLPVLTCFTFTTILQGHLLYAEEGTEAQKGQDLAQGCSGQNVVIEWGRTLSSSG